MRLDTSDAFGPLLAGWEDKRILLQNAGVLLSQASWGGLGHPVKVGVHFIKFSRAS